MTAVTRETLYAQVWEQPMTTVAEQYGVSSNYLARICEELKVPRPNRGYWANIRDRLGEGNGSVRASFSQERTVAVRVGRLGSQEEQRFA